jgi:6-phosphofructokinase 1
MKKLSISDPQTPSAPALQESTPSFVNSLRFGDGNLLKDGTGDFVAGGKTLKGRYIVRVGWDDVRGWFAEVCILV